MDQLIFKAKLAEQASRFEDVITIVKNALSSSPDLTSDHLNLLNIGYKNIISSKRKSWKKITSLQSLEEIQISPNHLKLCRSLRLQIESEINILCQEVFALTTSIMSDKKPSDESLVFLLKMQGDYYRYMAEYQCIGVNLTKYGTLAIENAEKKYRQAYDLACSRVDSVSPIRLSLVLNFSVFFYEIKNQQTEACLLAREAFDKAIENLDHVGKDQYEEVLKILQYIRDNLTLWSSSPQDVPKSGLDVEDL